MADPEAPIEPQKVEGLRSKLSTFLAHPAVATINLIAAVIGLIGLPLSFYFYYAAKEYRQLSYAVNPVKTVVLRAGQASRLTASFDNKTIETDITAAQVAVWNNGGLAVKRENVLKPIVIYTENNTPILEATIRKASREVTLLTMNTDELQKGRVNVSWNILEQNDGGVIQLIYAGNPHVDIFVDGVVEGQSQITRYDPTSSNHKTESARPQLTPEQRRQANKGAIFILLGGLFFLAIVYFIVRLKKGPSNGFVRAVENLALYLVAGVVFALFFELMKGGGVPPFGF